MSRYSNFSHHKKVVGNYLLLKTIGKGSFGKVKLGKHILTGSQVAIKIIDKSLISIRKGAEQRLKNELKILQEIKHPNVISLYEIIETKSFVYLITQYASGGELFDFIVSHGRLEEPLTRKFFRQIIDAVDFCHSHNIAHRDIKPENILLDEKLNIKIIDFGLSSFISSNGLCKTCCGSPSYSAPELIKGNIYDPIKADIWSMGVLLYALLCGKLPFPGTTTKEICESILSAKFSVPSHVSESAKDLLEIMIEPNPFLRASLEEIRYHKWLSIGYSEPPERIIIPKNILENPKESIINFLVEIGVSRDSLLTSLKKNKFNSFTATYLLVHMEMKKNPNYKLPVKLRDGKIYVDLADKSKKTPKNEDQNQEGFSNQKRQSGRFRITKCTEDSEKNIVPEKDQAKVEKEEEKKETKKKRTQEKIQDLHPKLFRKKIGDRSATVNLNEKITKDLRKPRALTVPKQEDLKEPEKKDQNSDSQEVDEVRQIRGPFQVTSTSSKSPTKIISLCRKILSQNNIPFASVSPFVIKCTVENIEFEIEVVSIPGLKKFNVIKFKRISGNCWEFQNIWSQIAPKLN
ncbi:protein kinase [Anaeramoeba ignava]|uniref:non-specific serine/threonine protein kinase n=1 Tax=Anaeramoeba ignava TaxID=1746090 RepID=A0A9Q0L708_ANAIG|nr:protein kinase [Anaeramoeba ignava]